MGMYCITQRTLLDTLYCPKWEGNPKERGYAYIHSWFILLSSKASLVAQTVKNLPAMQETWVQCLGGEDPLEKGMATYSSILAWRIPCTERNLVGYSLWGHKESNTTERLSFHFTLVNTQVSLEAQTIKNLPAIQETWVPSLGGENPLEKGMATHLVFLPGEFHRQRNLVGYSPWDHRVRHDWETLASLTLLLVNTQTVVMNLKDELTFIFHTIFPCYFFRGKQLHLLFMVGKWSNCLAAFYECILFVSLHCFRC